MPIHFISDIFMENYIALFGAININCCLHLVVFANQMLWLVSFCCRFWDSWNAITAKGIESYSCRWSQLLCSHFKCISALTFNLPHHRNLKLAEQRHPVLVKFTAFYHVDIFLHGSSQEVIYLILLMPLVQFESGFLRWKVKKCTHKSLQNGKPQNCNS